MNLIVFASKIVILKIAFGNTCELALLIKRINSDKNVW